MIDTDKYEGHTPAPWKAENKCYRNGVDENNLGQLHSYLRTWGVTLSEEKLSDYRENRIGYDVMHKADAQLIADAPLLLEEVKRLREAIADIANNMEAADDSYMSGFIEDLRKVVE
tara:strand:- start:977 stop:1324 length:348 start_codon:yes stop_codon:yes gene_type:complete